jgi:tetratricopeptide (TPR) repeat protein
VVWFGRLPAAPSTALAPARPSRRAWWFVALLVLVIAGVFAPGLGGPFVFDDGPNVADNGALRRSDFLEAVVQGPEDSGNTLAGRPVARLSLALNRAVGGHSPLSYRIGNLLLHAVAAVLLWSIARRLLVGKAGTAAGGRHPAPAVVAAAIALLWAIHPLHSTSVLSVAQRVEIVSAVLMLAAGWAFLRSLEARTSGRWQGLAVAATFGAVAAKETAVVVPVAILLLDRAAGTGCVKAALRTRPGFYGALFGSWVLLAVLVAGTGGRGGTAGFDAGVSVWRYLLTQADAVATYLQLVVWPHPLVFDYGTGLAAGLGEVAVQAVLVLALLGATAWAWSRAPRAASAGALFFLLLAPTSSVVPIASQTIAEHRMYLALAVPLGLFAAGLARVAPRFWLPAAAAAAVALAGLTAVRARTFATEIGLWADTVAKRPDNARARINLALALQAADRADEAVAELERAARVAPESADAQHNLGVALARAGRLAAARAAYLRAISLRPGFAEAQHSLGLLDVAEGRWPDAAAAFRAAVAARPAFAAAQADLALALLEAGDPGGAAAAAEQAVRLAPDRADAHHHLGNARAAQGRFPEAERAFTAALALDPARAETRANLGHVLVQTGRLDEALQAYEAALATRPDLVPALRNSAIILAQKGRFAEARARFSRLAVLVPGDPQARDALRQLPGGE